MMDDNKALFDYWYGRVKLRNHEVIEAPGHIKTYELRHECTNYDDLRFSKEVQLLAEPERSRVIAIVKYECTAKVLQHRASRLREKANQLENACSELDQQKSKLLKLLRALQEKLFGKDQDIERLKARITALETENEALQAESENDKAYAELLTEFEQLKKQYEAVEKRRRELAQNNKSLGGRVAHTKRFRQERDDARALAVQQQQQIVTLTQENEQFQRANEQLCSEIKKLRMQIQQM